MRQTLIGAIIPATYGHPAREVEKPQVNRREQGDRSAVV
jgi:hypothetical protein